MAPLFLTTLLSQTAAHACSVCSGPVTPEQQQALLSSTIFLSLLPLAMIFGIVYAVYSAYKGQRAEQQSRPLKRVPTQPKA